MSETTTLTALVAYVVLVSIVLSYVATGVARSVVIGEYQFTQTYDFTKNDTFENLTDYIVDDGEWVKTNYGMMSNDTGTNRALFIRELDINEGQSIYQLYRYSNPEGRTFKIFSKYLIFLGVFRNSRGLEFRTDGVYPFANWMYQDKIHYYNGTQFEGATVKLQYNVINVTTAEFVMGLDGREFYRDNQLPINANELFTDVYFGGIEVDGDTFYISQYVRTDRTAASIFDPDASIWGFLQTLGYVIGWTLPAEYFSTPVGVYVFTFANILLIKIPILGIVYLVVRLIRGGG